MRASLLYRLLCNSQLCNTGVTDPNMDVGTDWTTLKGAKEAVGYRDVTHFFFCEINRLKMISCNPIHKLGPEFLFG